MAAEPGVETIDAVCDEIEQLGVDAEGPVVDLGLLPRALGAKCRTWPFFRADERCLPIDRPRDDAPPDVHIALNPGHYFLLYPDDPARAARAEPGSPEGKDERARCASPAHRARAASPRHRDVVWA